MALPLTGLAGMVEAHAIKESAVPRIITPSTPEHEIDQTNERMFGTPKERLDFYRREIQYETTILANRTDAYLAAQSFLVIAYVSSMGNLNQSWGEMFTLMVPAFLALLGVLSTLTVSYTHLTLPTNREV